LVVISCTSVVAAQKGTDERAPAVVLFEQGRALMAQDRYAEACQKFADALAIARGAGIQYNLAACYERVGRLASAWTHYLEVAEATRREGQTEREEAARARAHALEPRLTRLVITPLAPDVALAIDRNGIRVMRGEWNTPIPLDPGEYAIEAKAPGRRPWQKRVAVAGEGKTIQITIPALEAERARGIAPEPSDRRTNGRAQRTIGIVGVGAGAAGLVVGAVFGALALAEKEKAGGQCAEELSCDERGADRIERAKALSYVSTASVIGGSVLAVGGTILWLTAPSERAGVTVRTAASPMATRFEITGRY
jgi:hypothetical protein